MNASGLLSLMLAAANFLAAVAVLAAAPARALHRAFGLLGLGMAGWSIAWLLLDATEPVPAARTLGHLACIAILLLPVAWFHYLHLALDRPPKRRFARAYVAAGAAAVLALAPVLGPLERFPAWGGLAPPPDFAPLAGLGLLALGIASVRSLAPNLRDEAPDLRRRARIPALVGGFLALLGLNDLLPLLGAEHYPFTSARVPPLGFWAPVAFPALLVRGLRSDQLIELRVAFGRWLAAFPRTAFFLTLCALALFLVNAWRPDLLPAPATFVCLAIVLIAYLATGFFSPRSLTHHADRLRDRVYGGRFAYLEKIRALSLLVRRETDLAAGLGRVCKELRATLGIDLVEIWYRDANGEPRVIPPRTGLNDITRLSRWDDVVREARRWRDREDLWVIPLQSGGAEPAGYLRLVASGWSLQLNELDREAVAELAGAVLHQVEREVIRVSLDLRQVNEAKDRFLAGINHEVRNPLNGITGLLHLLRQEGLRGRPAYLVDTLSACAEQLVATMDNALDFASLTQGRVVARPTSFELGALVRGSVAHHAIGAGDRIVLRVPEGEHWLLGDAGKLRQIISNYVGNALKYGKPPRAELRARLQPAASGGQELRVEVLSPSDTPADENLDEWFRPFRRGQRAAEIGAAGSGLGLAICQRLAEAMEGAVGVRRETDQLAFWLAVPVSAADRPREPAPAHAPTDEPAPRPFHVLAIEDEAYNRLILGHHLRAWNLDADWAGSGAEAEQKIRERRPDLVIMDWLLGDTDGATLLPRLLAAHADDPPPVLVLSAYATDEKESQALAVGARRFLSKPLRPDTLLAAIQEIVPGFRLAGPPRSGTPAPPPILEPQQLEQGLRDEWRGVTDLWRLHPDQAANRVHRLRGLARHLPAPDLHAALRRLEKALTDGAAIEVTEARLAAARELLEGRAAPAPEQKPASAAP